MFQIERESGENLASRMFLPRRKLLSIGGRGLLGLGLAPFLAPRSAHSTTESVGRHGPSPRAKSVIFLYQFGGPSHLETFDPKPDAPREIRGQWDSIATNVPGLRVGDKLPRMAEVMDKVTLVRGLHHGMKNHNPASYYMLTGHEPPVDDIRLPPGDDLYPAYGAVADRFAPGRSASVPGFVGFPHVIRDGSITPGQRAHFLGTRFDPLVMTADPNAPTYQPPELMLPDDMSPARLEDRRRLLSVIDAQSRLLDESVAARSADASYARAVELINSSAVRAAFDLSVETDSTRDAYGRHSFGQSCLLARRLVESGVKFVNVYFSNSIGGQSKTSGGWDTHGFNNTSMYPILRDRHLPITDQTLPALLTDLDERGLLESTLVVWLGEFGRTPKLNKQSSRDHWPHCFTALLAGGGMKRGFAFGRSDADGAYPADGAMRPDDLAATLFTALGIDSHAMVTDKLSRPVPVAAGNCVDALFV
jgi:hypothetical protein